MENMPNGIDPSWHPHLKPLFEDSKMKLINTEILPQTKFYPEGKNIFRVFNAPLHAIKVVIIGQDPYPNGEATGLAFGVKSNSPVPASLAMIHRELRRTGFQADTTYWKTLEHWEKQGVFLFNLSLTVEAKRAGSHMGFWYWFAREVIEVISNQNKPVWMLWGSKAQSFKDHIKQPKVIYASKWEATDMVNANVVLEAYHPAAAKYDASKQFIGCDHFNLCNQILEIKGQQIIHW